MYYIIKKGRLYKESVENSNNIETIKTFGRKWETITHSEGDKDISSIWNREKRYHKINGTKFEDGMYKLLPGGKFQLIFRAETW